MNDDWRSLGEVVASVTKIECVTRNRVDRVGIGRTAAVELNGKRFVAVINIGADASQRRRIRQTEIGRAQRVAAGASAVRNSFVRSTCTR